MLSAFDDHRLAKIANLGEYHKAIRRLGVVPDFETVARHRGWGRSTHEVLGLVYSARVALNRRELSHDLLADVAQRVLAELHARWADYDPSQSLAAWIKTIARSRLIDYYRELDAAEMVVERDEHRHPVVTGRKVIPFDPTQLWDGDGDEGFELTLVDDSGDEVQATGNFLVDEGSGDIGQSSIRDTVRRALARLSEDQREILVLYVLDEFSYADISLKLDITEASARKRVSRAKADLAAELEPWAASANLLDEGPAPSTSWGSKYRGHDARLGLVEHAARQLGTLGDEESSAAFFAALARRR